jgi:hypothetical protein
LKGSAGQAFGILADQPFQEREILQQDRDLARMARADLEDLRRLGEPGISKEEQDEARQRMLDRVRRFTELIRDGSGQEGESD